MIVYTLIPLVFDMAPEACPEGEPATSTCKSLKDTNWRGTQNTNDLKHRKIFRQFVLKDKPKKETNFEKSIGYSKLPVSKRL